MEKYKNRLIIIFVLIVVLIISIFFSIQKNQDEFICKDCNVILISIDTLRADHLSSYGYFRNTSPNIDKIASEGILFKNAFSQAPITLPSHMSIFTSLYPSTHGINIIFQNQTLSPEFKTIAEILQLYNYRTFWRTSLSNEFLSLKAGFQRGFEDFKEPRAPFRVINFTNIINLIGENKQNKFFLFLHTDRVHDPYLIGYEDPNIFYKNYTGKIVGIREEFNDLVFKNISETFRDNPEKIYEIFDKDTLNKNLELFTGENKKNVIYKHFQLLNSSYNRFNRFLYASYIAKIYWTNVNSSDVNDVEYLKSLYDSAIFYTDEQIDRIIKKLYEENLLDKTIIVITSDHGEKLGEHGGFFHNTLYVEDLHVPLIIYNPKIKPHREISAQVQSIDIMPTILDMVGIEIPHQAEGKSLVNLIKGDVKDLNNFTFAEWFAINQLYSAKSIRSENWKLIYEMTTKKVELYKIDEDPYETLDVSNKYPTTVNDLKLKLFEWIVRHNNSEIKNNTQIPFIEYP